MVDLSNIPDAPQINLEGIPNAVPTKNPIDSVEVNKDKAIQAKQQLSDAFETAKSIGNVYPIADAAANIFTQLYGVPISGIAGILSSPANFIWKDANKKVVETIQEWLIYQPQTEKGKELSEAAMYPFEKLNKLGSEAGNKVLEKTNSPAMATMVHTAIAGAPAIIGLRRIPKGVQSAILGSKEWIGLNLRQKGWITRNLDQTIKDNPSMTQGEIIRRWSNLKDEAIARDRADYIKAKEAKPISEPTIRQEPGEGIGGPMYTILDGEFKGRTLTKPALEELGIKTPEQIPITKSGGKPPSEPPPTLPPEPEVSIDELDAGFRKHREVFFQEKSEKLFRIDVEARMLQKELKSTLDLKKYSETAKDIDKAIQIHIDTKRNPGHIEEFYNKLTDEQKAVVDLSQNLPEEVMPIVAKIEKSYQQVGIEALDAEIIRNTLDNYAARIWDLGEKPASEQYRKFGTTTRHAKQRVFETIIEGWAAKFELKVEGSINNLKILKQEIAKTIENRRFLNNLQQVKDNDGNSLISDQQLTGYKRIEHPNFTSWKWAGKVEEGKVYGKNFFAAEDGTLFERRALYAPKKQANNLNNVFGTSKLIGVPGVDTVTKYNAIAKAWILQTSLFHHQAFLRSYYLPGLSPKKWAELVPTIAFRQGIEAIERLDPIVIQGVRNGLTLGVRQDWEEHLLREKTIFGKVLDKAKITKEVKTAILHFRELQSDWLFGELGASLKAKTFVIEYREQLKNYPEEHPDVVAERVAALVNDDFGGLNLERMGRNPTLQHIMRLVLLAPDWTESNVRTMLKTFPMGKDGNRFYTSQASAKLYRKFWVGVAIKGMGITVLLNYLLAGGDLNKMEDNYREAWEAGNLKALAVDVTPIYKALGGNTRDKKYWFPIGHFKDPVKFISDPPRSAHHKGSVVYGVFHEAVSGVDWAGRPFTTFDELLHQKKTVKWGQGGAIEWEQFPSYLINQVIGLQPIQIQNGMAWIAGEQEGFDAIANSIGLGVTTEHKKQSKRR